MGLVITEVDVGGAERSLVALATGLDRAGRWHPKVYALGPEGPLAAPLRAWGIRVACLDVNARRPIQAVRAARLGAPERASRADPELPPPCERRRGLAGPMAGHPWVVGGLRVAERQKRWHLGIDRATLRLAAGAVCVSEGVRQFSSTVGGWPDDRLTVIPNGVDVARINRDTPEIATALGIDQDALLILFVGRLHVQKGLTTLLDAAERLLVERPGLNWQLVLVGHGPNVQRSTSGSRRALRSAAGSTCSARATTSPRSCKPATCSSCPRSGRECPTSFSKRWPRRAVIGTAVEGTEDLIVPGTTGWLVPPADVEGLTAALLDAATDPERRRRFGEAARAGRDRVHARHGRTPYEHLWAGLLGYELG